MVGIVVQHLTCLNVNSSSSCERTNSACFPPSVHQYLVISDSIVNLTLKPRIGVPTSAPHVSEMGSFHTVKLRMGRFLDLPAGDVWGFTVYLLESSLWISSAKLGSSPHQKSQSSLRPGVWCRLHTLSTSAARHRLKLHRIGSSSVTGNRMGDEVGPCQTNRRHFIPVKSA